MDSYAINYDIGTFESEKPVAEIVAMAVPAVVVLECSREERALSSALAPKPAPPPSQERNTATSVQSAFVCGRSVDYAVDPTGNNAGFLGVWTGNWNNASRLCGGLIVEKIASDGAAEVIYVYGPANQEAGSYGNNSIERAF